MRVEPARLTPGVDDRTAGIANLNPGLSAKAKGELALGTNRAGSTRSVQGTAPFTLVVGNAANVTLEQDGKAVDLAAHVRGSVARLTLR